MSPVGRLLRPGTQTAGWLSGGVTASGGEGFRGRSGAGNVPMQRRLPKHHHRL